MNTRLDARGPEDFYLQWFDKAAESVEVLKANPGEFWRVWVSNGEPGHAWGGSAVCECATENDARLIALALQRLRDERSR